MKTEVCYLFLLIHTVLCCKEEAKTEKAINFPWKNKGKRESVPQKLYSKGSTPKTLLQKPLTRRYCCVKLTSSLGNPEIQQSLPQSKGGMTLFLCDSQTTGGNWVWTAVQSTSIKGLEKKSSRPCSDEATKNGSY